MCSALYPHVQCPLSSCDVPVILMCCAVILMCCAVILMCCAVILMCCTCYSYQILIKLEFSGQIFEKCTDIKFHENPSSGAELYYADRQTDRHDETNSCFSQICERTK